MPKNSVSPSGPQLPELLTVPEVGDRTKTSVREVWRWVHEQGLPVYRLGRRVLISVDDLADFLAARRRGWPHVAV
jgi:excisionase family DNA binding protein